MVSICLFFIFLTGWILATYFVKKDSQKFIGSELKNLFDICKKFFASLKNLIGILVSNSLSSNSIEANLVEENVLDEDDEPLSLVPQVKEIQTRSVQVAHEEDDDIALSSFSPEVVQVINEEEEKVA
tara:strand:+ start:364 stop:744 length:381 start_codon:yes stop_codon:yes gene_type:complete